MLTLLLALAMTLLPVSGAAATQPEPMACHQQAPDELGDACAEHCMTQVAAPQVAPTPQRSIENTIRAERALLADARAPRGGVAPETPPPRR